jgi:hypothetical protein
MNIDSKADFAGQPMLLVRDLVREIHRRYDGAFDADDWAYVFAAGSTGDRDRVLAELAARGYVRPAGAAEDEELPFRARGSDGPVWVLTELGNQLANASAARPLRRASAEKALAGFLDRVDEVEANPLCLHVVTEAILFGSMLDPGRQTVSDVDIALELVRDDVKVGALGLSDREFAIQAVGQFFHRARPGEGEPVASEMLVLQRLKARKWSLSLHFLREWTAAGRPLPCHLVLYRRGEGRYPP